MVTVSVAANATSPLSNIGIVSGGGEVVTANNTASDSTVVNVALPTLSEQLYRSARWLRVFVARPRPELTERALLDVLQRSPSDLRDALDRGDSLLR